MPKPRLAISEERKQYIRDNHKTLSVPQMRAVLRCGFGMITEFMAAEKLPVLKRQNTLPRNHPWRRQNAQLESYYIMRGNTNQIRK
ncbi:MAG: hypothetical protein JWP27_1455 [Flaviaesturariibacter sp.]|nr:hypothetical protein [Flaviaesturariibacter sp.]